MNFRDLRAFIHHLEARGELHRIRAPVDPHLEITEVCDRVLRAGGPALLFENPRGFDTPVLANLFGTTDRIARGMGQTDLRGLRSLGESLAQLKEPDHPRGARELWRQMPQVRKVMAMAPRVERGGDCQRHVLTGSEVDLGQWPVQTCWPDDAGPLLTWPLVITRGPHRERQNVGIYRMQVLARNRVILRWLDHRGGALDWQAWRKAYPDRPFPVAVAIGADPATLLAAVTPIPDSLSEFAFAGLLRGSRTSLTGCLTHDLAVPANAEIVLEGHVYPDDYAEEGPFGDHTGFYNEVDRFPVLTVERITHRSEPIYHSTFTGRPPDEPSVLGSAMNELFVPVLRKQIPEIVDFHLPPAACSYRWAVASIRKQYPGHARRIMMAIWSMLPQFSYTKWIVIVDESIDVRSTSDVLWAMSTRMDPQRDTLCIDRTPIDSLDFASPVAGLGSRMGFDATDKWPGETDRQWGRPIRRDPDVSARVDQLWSEIGL